MCCALFSCVQGQVTHKHVTLPKATRSTESWNSKAAVVSAWKMDRNSTRSVQHALQHAKRE